MSNRFAILRIKKHKNLGSVYHVARHHTRESVCKTADPARLHLNKSNGPATARGVVDAIHARIDDAQTRAKRKFTSKPHVCGEVELNFLQPIGNISFCQIFKDHLLLWLGRKMLILNKFFCGVVK